ncbi:MAG: hypothetical protein CVU38_18145 [Chloroflexi bacterium HGW-Chloroflexi-1]|nr:MAG: hypothetical protein CVU38_18145 [Chloroflexi bacterium HGW-Chloroflexi-1]
MRTRHAAHYLSAGREANSLYTQGGDQIAEALRRFDAAWPHLQAAWEWLKTQGDEAALRWLSDFPGQVVYTLDLRLPPRRKIPLLETALAAARRLGDRRNEGTHLGNLGPAYWSLGDAARATGSHEQALAIDRAIGDRRGEAIDAWNLGLAYEEQGDLAHAAELMQILVDFERSIGHADAEKDARRLEEVKRKRDA